MVTTGNGIVIKSANSLSADAVYAKTAPTVNALAETVGLCATPEYVILIFFLASLVVLFIQKQLRSKNGYIVVLLEDPPSQT